MRNGMPTSFHGKIHSAKKIEQHNAGSEGLILSYSIVEGYQAGCHTCSMNLHCQ
jgi:hypothetical protein